MTRSASARIPTGNRIHPRRLRNYSTSVVSPWALTWDDENYYLVAFDSEAGIMKHYRVDKMLDISLGEAKRDGQTIYDALDVSAYSRKTFGMFSGEEKTIQLLCDNTMIGVIIDRFGHDVWLIPQGEDHFKTRVLVSVSPQFFGWVTGIGSGMKITGPENVKQQYKEYMLDVLQNY